MFRYLGVVLICLFSVTACAQSFQNKDRRTIGDNRSCEEGCNCHKMPTRSQQETCVAYCGCYTTRESPSYRVTEFDAACANRLTTPPPDGLKQPKLINVQGYYSVPDPGQSPERGCTLDPSKAQDEWISNFGCYATGTISDREIVTHNRYFDRGTSDHAGCMIRPNGQVIVLLQDAAAGTTKTCGEWVLPPSDGSISKRSVADISTGPGRGVSAWCQVSLGH